MFRCCVFGVRWGEDTTSLIRAVAIAVCTIIRRGKLACVPTACHSYRTTVRTERTTIVLLISPEAVLFFPYARGHCTGLLSAILSVSRCMVRGQLTLFVLCHRLCELLHIVLLRSSVPFVGNSIMGSTIDANIGRLT